ncbi:UDP-glucose/GDP-mannose dehydrogenase family protein [soil metagenome]
MHDELVASEFRVGVVGAGHVGLVTGACLAHLGHRVTGIDKDEAKVETLVSGGIPIYEPGLEEMVADGLRNERLSFATSLEETVAHADFMFIAVDTPQGDEGAADLSKVADVAHGIGRALAKVERESPLIVVNKGTVPVGSGDYVSMRIREGVKEIGDNRAEFRVVSNPEFLREGSAVYDSLFPDRIVVGANSRQDSDAMRALYERVIEQSFPTDLDPRPKETVPFITTDLASAEMIKYAANAFLATKISFINEIGNICELVGANVTNVAAGMGLDDRIGSRFLSAGIGWGGSCFLKDVMSLKNIAGEYDYEAEMLSTTVSINQRQRRRVIHKLQRHLQTLKGKRIALLGLSFKPNTEDLREAPSLEIARMLHSLGAEVAGYDPVSGKAALALVPELQLALDPYDALTEAHAAVLVTEWEEFRELDLSHISSSMEPPRLLVDGRNFLNSRAVSEAGLLYEGFGRV